MVLAVAASIALIRDWIAPYPRIWTSQNGAYAASIVPPNEKVKEARIRLFTLDGDDRERTLWRVRLTHMPRRLEVSEDGHAAAVGLYPYPRENEAVVIFGDNGRILAQHEVRSLLTPEELANAPRSPFGEVNWMRASYWASIRHQLNAPKGLNLPSAVRNVGEAKGIRNDFPVAYAIALYNGQEIWFDLVTGKAYRLPPYRPEV